MLSSALLGIQFWIFLWAPINGRALQVSLGYMLFPLVMVIFGVILYRERLALYQKIAVFLAVLGVGNLLYRVGSVSWEALVVCLGYPAYFIVRKKLHTNNLGGLWFDCLLMFPLALYAALGGESGVAIFAIRPPLIPLVIILGLLSAVSMTLIIIANKLLPFGLFGMLNYVEPVLLVIVSLLLGERILPDEMFTYASIFIAIVILALGTLRSGSSRLPKKCKVPKVPPEK